MMVVSPVIPPRPARACGVRRVVPQERRTARPEALAGWTRFEDAIGAEDRVQDGRALRRVGPVAVPRQRPDLVLQGHRGRPGRLGGAHRRAPDGEGLVGEGATHHGEGVGLDVAGRAGVGRGGVRVPEDLRGLEPGLGRLDPQRRQVAQRGVRHAPLGGALRDLRERGAGPVQSQKQRPRHLAGGDDPSGCRESAAHLRARHALAVEAAGRGRRRAASS